MADLVLDPSVNNLFPNGATITPQIVATRVPTANDKYDVGTFWFNSANETLYGQLGFVAGVPQWELIASSSGSVVSVLGTANQITASTTLGVVTLSIPAAFIAPGSIASTTTLTGGTGITATTGNIVASTGNITSTLGSVSAATTVTGGTGLIATTGGVTVNGGDIINSHSDAGTDVTIEVTNSDNTNGASRAGVEIATGGSSGGDPYLSFQISGVGASTMTMGLDNSASDLFVISNSSAIGTSNALTLSQAGALTATTSITATLGDITATNGNLVLSGAGNKLNIQASTAATDSLGVTAAMVAGATTITSSAITAASVILYSRATLGTAAGHVSITAQAPGSATLTSSDGTETSTFNYLIIN